ncbi:MAG: hypothetical protein VYC39_09215 [Myxococcota bacterium]|nr:hypothetical protein [Myxococcota bacterium]
MKREKEISRIRGDFIQGERDFVKVFEKANEKSRRLGGCFFWTHRVIKSDDWLEKKTTVAILSLP